MTLSLLQGYYKLRTPFMLQSMPGRICHVCKEAAYHQAFGFLPIRSHKDEGAMSDLTRLIWSYLSEEHSVTLKRTQKHHATNQRAPLN